MSDKLTNLKINLIKYGESICSNPDNVESFRKIEEKIEEWFIDEHDDDFSSEIFILYLIIRHVLMILTGDVRYHGESEGLYKDVFHSFGRLFICLEKLMSGEEKRKDEYYNQLNKVITTYLKNVKKINELISSKK